MSNNVDGLAGKLFKAHVKSYEQAHNYLFLTKTLKKYFTHTDFKVLKTSSPYFGTGYSSWTDYPNFAISYIKYLYLKLSSKLNKPETYDFASPTFYGNYLNIYARKLV